MGCRRKLHVGSENRLGSRKQWGTAVKCFCDWAYVSRVPQCTLKAWGLNMEGMVKYADDANIGHINEIETI